MNDVTRTSNQHFDYRVEGTKILWDFPSGIGERAATLPELYLWAQIEQLQQDLAREVGTREARVAEITHHQQRVVDLEHAYDLLRQCVAALERERDQARADYHHELAKQAGHEPPSALTEQVLLDIANEFDQGPGATFEFDKPTLLRMMRGFAATVEGRARDGAVHEPPDVPYAWTIPGDDTADVNGFIAARVDQRGEFTKPLYAAGKLPTARALVCREVCQRAVEIIKDATTQPPSPELRDDEFIAWTCRCRFINMDRNEAMCAECGRKRPTSTKGENHG